MEQKQVLGNQKLLKIHDVADLLGVHEITVRRWSNHGYLQSFRLGKRGDRRFPEEQIQLLFR